MQNSGFPTYHNILHVSFPDFDVQKGWTLVLCCSCFCAAVEMV